jgi:hypothetical protein
MEKEKNIIRPLRGAMTNDEYAALGTCLLKFGYAVRIATREAPQKKTKEKVVEYWEEK